MNLQPFSLRVCISMYSTRWKRFDIICLAMVAIAGQIKETCDFDIILSALAAMVRLIEDTCDPKNISPALAARHISIITKTILIVPHLLLQQDTFDKHEDDPDDISPALAAIARPIKEGDTLGLNRLRVLLRAVCLRRTKDLISKTLPSKTVEVHKLHLEGAHKEAYDGVFFVVHA